VSHKFLCTRSRNWETHNCFWIVKLIEVENVEDNDQDINQFEDMPLFTNPMNIKHIVREFDKNLMPYMRIVGNGKVV
jgi:hypothetical protein